MKTTNLILLASLCLLPQLAHADDAALDAPYKRLVHPRADVMGRAVRAGVPSKSDVLAVIAKQTPVKSQAARGTCSIFSATALTESLAIIAGKADASVDLSEEYLEYLIAQHATDDGSNSPSNFDALHSFGIPSEAKMPYIGATWKALTDGDAQNRCGKLEGISLAHCLTGHRDAALLGMKETELSASGGDLDFLEARREAQENQKRLFTQDGADQSGIIQGTAEIKALLAKGIPVTLDIDFYYGAWNHRMAPDMGISRDTDAWSKGIVGYPERKSMDIEHSNEHRAGHSVVIVGYDDTREVEYTIKMTDGSMKKFKRKGVYYFKNSWGTAAFGLTNEIEGQNFPGYGIITQDYANEYGQFFQMVL